MKDASCNSPGDKRKINQIRATSTKCHISDAFQVGNDGLISCTALFMCKVRPGYVVGPQYSICPSMGCDVCLDESVIPCSLTRCSHLHA